MALLDTVVTIGISAVVGLVSGASAGTWWYRGQIDKIQQLEKQVGDLTSNAKNETIRLDEQVKKAQCLSLATMDVADRDLGALRQLAAAVYDKNTGAAAKIGAEIDQVRTAVSRLKC